MKNNLLTEVAVESTWISSVSYNRPNKILTLVTNVGSTYKIANVPRSFFDKWKNSPSKGKFYHENVKDRFNLIKVK